jgi:putative copper resistance protein D
MPSPVVAAAYALHMAATVIWIGGLVFLAFLATPLLARFPPAEREAARQASSRRFVPLAWLCLAIFVVTGLTQMSANPGYAGLFIVQTPWSAAILAKHLVVGLMATVLACQTWIVHPRLERASLGLDGADPTAQTRWRRLDLQLIRSSAVLGLLVLVLTAIARASN